MIIQTLSTGDVVHRYNKNIIVNFKGKRAVLSTGQLNGGYREDLEAVFNHDAKAGAGMGCVLKAPTYNEHLRIVAREIGLDDSKVAAIGTAADMENASIKFKKFRDITVTAIVTAGIENNGGRVGDPASFHEEDDKIEQLKPGTINMIIIVDGKLDANIMARVLVTATEAKTAALQELIASSKYSNGIATGSGTDDTIVISNLESKKQLNNAGKHSKLGELIGLVAKEAVKEALNLQTALCPEMQKSIFRRVERYGINEHTVWNRYLEVSEKKEKIVEKNILNKLDYVHYIYSIDKDEELVALVSLYVHLIDQFQWGLLSGKIVYDLGVDILLKLAKKMNIKVDIKRLADVSNDDVVKILVDNLNDLLVKRVCSN